jgi:5-methylthioadenosine/S-adenosylhomocysteine deaminase
MATRGGAAAAGIGHLVGSLETGKRADIVLMRPRGPEMIPLFDVMAALVYAGDRSAVETVMVDGRIVLAGRRLQTMSEERIVTEAERLAWALLDRAGIPALQDTAKRTGLFRGTGPQS